MLLNTKALKTALLCAGKDDARYMLNGVKVETDGTVVGTDGHMLGIVSPQTEHEEREYPAIPGVETPASPEPLTPCVIARAGIEKVLKTTGKPPKHFPILENVLLDTAQTNKNGKAVIHNAVDLDNPQTLNLEKVDGTYPRYTACIPKEEPAYRIYFDAALLARLAQAAQTLHGKDTAVLELEFFEHGLSPMRATTTNKSGQSLTAIIMPFKWSKQAGVLPRTEAVDAES